MIRPIFFAVCLFTSMILATEVSAQQPLKLPVAGTMNVNFVYSWIPGRPDGWPADSRITGIRFGGRVALQITRSFDLGLAVASWEGDDVQSILCTAGDDCQELLAFRGEAFATALFGQLRSRYGFVRGGAGPVRSDRYVPDGRTGLQTGLIHAIRSYRAGLTFGVGHDVRIAQFLFITMSVDGVLLPTVSATSRELRWAILGGLGLTVQ